MASLLRYTQLYGIAYCHNITHNRHVASAAAAAAGCGGVRDAKPSDGGI